jgi:hypothetical protein
MHAARGMLREAEKRATGGEHELKAIVDRERLEQLAAIAAATKVLGVRAACGGGHGGAAVDGGALKEISN